MKSGKKTFVMCVLLSIILLMTPLTTSAATVSKYQKRIANKADVFIYHVLSETQIRVRDVYWGQQKVSKKDFLSQLKKVYNGKLSSKQKAVIASTQVKASQWVYPPSIEPGGIGYISLSKVKKEYKKIFGSKTSLKLPAVKYPTQVGKYYLSYAKNGDKVCVLAHDAEDDYSSGYAGVKKKGSIYTVTKKYNYYSHWGIKARGEKPTQSVTVKIKLKKKKSSPYKYNIVGITFS